MRSKGKTIAGLHVRRGDFLEVPTAGFTLITPTGWWMEWLRQIWSEWEEPVLFLCSDDLEAVRSEFAEFHPVTWQDLTFPFPERWRSEDIEFYIDFFILSQCDVVGISNSIFSFAASMLNDRGKCFVRPHWDFSTRFISFDPRDSDPLLYIGGDRPRFYKSLTDILSVTCATQAMGGRLKTLLIYLPKSLLRRWTIRFYLGYQVEGWMGMLKCLLWSLGWRSVWRSSPVDRL